LSHEAVAEAVCFAVADEMYGQDIHAAVVLKKGKEVKEKELQDYVGTKVVKFKIPKKVNFPLGNWD
jgi:oxalate---CoA ligase